MKLTDSGIEHRAEWQAKGYALPAFDRAAMRVQTKESPRWVQFGIGNLFRAFLLRSADRLLAAGTMESGIVAVKGYDPALLEPVFRAHDNLTLLVTLQNNGAHRKEVLGGLAESLSMEVPSADWERLIQIFQAPSLQLATFTLTEKAYALADASDNFSADVAADFQNGPDKAVSFFGKLAALLWMRFESGAGPLALVSLDNCSHNGDRLKQAILPFAQAWEKNGMVSEAFAKALDNPAVFSFPWTMIDKITPRPRCSDRADARSRWGGRHRAGDHRQAFLRGGICQCRTFGNIWWWRMRSPTDARPWNKRASISPTVRRWSGRNG